MNEYIIKVTNLQKTYKTGSVEFKALKGVNFKIRKGEMIAIMGPSGSGKSTTMHILGILDKQDAGSYELNGKEIKNYSRNQLAEIRNKEIGFVFQAFNLLPRATVAKNVELPLIYAGISKTVRLEKVMKALASVGLDSKAENMPNQISGGQIQRVAIARAIICEPSIILADEPTGNLDTKTADEIMEIFQKMNEEGKTIILITHEPDIAAYCQRIITLKDGLIVSDITKKESNNGN